MRFYNDLENEELVDSYGEFESIGFDDIDFYELCKMLNKMECDKLEYKRRLSTLKHRIRRLVDDR